MGDGMGAVWYAAYLLMLANLAIGDLATAGAIGGTVTGLAVLAWGWRRGSECWRAKAPVVAEPVAAAPQPVVLSEREQLRAIRLWLRDLGREDAALSDSDVRALVDVIIHICRHGHITRQTLGGGRLRITVEVTDTGRLGR